MNSIRTGNRRRRALQRGATIHWSKPAMGRSHAAPLIDIQTVTMVEMKHVPGDPFADFRKEMQRAVFNALRLPDSFVSAPRIYGLTPYKDLP